MLFSGAKSFRASCKPSWPFLAAEKKEETVKAVISSAKNRYLPAFEKVRTVGNLLVLLHIDLMHMTPQNRKSALHEARAYHCN